MDNSIKYQLLGNMQLNNQTVLFLTIQFSINNVFVHTRIAIVSTPLKCFSYYYVQWTIQLNISY